MVLDTPAALYRATDGDLASWIPETGWTDVSRLSTLAYLASALIHCRSRGVRCHQDLKPHNVLMRDYRKNFQIDCDDDVFNVPLIADFGMANKWFDEEWAGGPRPYMAPEQFLEGKATGASDVFSLGVIIFEVMSRGMHPLGGRISDWWPVPKEGFSKKWLRDDLWTKWAERGNPISTDVALGEPIAEIVRDCLAQAPDARPSLAAVEARLMEALRSLDRRAHDQARFRIDYANSNVGTVDDWEWRNRRIERLRGLVAERFPVTA